MIYFSSDYMEGAHPLILQRLMDTNLEKTPGYGMDAYCESAKDKIRKACACTQAEIYFLEGGTQTNAVVIDGLLCSFEGVLAAKTSHINTHEAGAIEFDGHKVLELSEHNGKISAEQVRNYLENFYADENHEHMVAPGMVYITHPTEYGTLYEKEELEALHQVCTEYQIPLYLDGARLGYGLAVKRSITLPEIARYCDVFYIGGTKVGAFCGEAVVFTRPGMVKGFFTLMKQHGALMAKGRFLGLQFDTLFTDRLYWTIAESAVTLADKLKQIFTNRGFETYIDSPTNQQFIILTQEQKKKLEQEVAFSFWENLPDKRIVTRFATSWATLPQDLTTLSHLLDTL